MDQGSDSVVKGLAKQLEFRTLEPEEMPDGRDSLPLISALKDRDKEEYYY